MHWQPSPKAKPKLILNHHLLPSGCMIVFCKLIQYVNVKVKKQGHTDISKVDDYIRVQMSGNDEASCLKQATYEFDTSQGWDAISDSNRKASRRSMLSSEAAAALKAPPPPQHPQKTFCSSEGWSSSPAQASTTLRLSPTSSFKLFSGTAREPGLWGLSQISEQWFPLPLSPPQHVFSSSHRLLGGRHHLLHLGRLGPLSGARHPKRRNRQQQKSRKLLLGRGDLY